MSTKTDFTWNVLLWDFNQDKLEWYDIVPMFDDAISSMKRSSRPQDKKSLSEFLKGEAMYHFWSKCGYEVIVSGWPKSENEEKIDAYYQLMANWDNLIDLFWDKVYVPNYLKTRKKKS